MPPIGPLLNALGLSGGVVAAGFAIAIACAVTVAGWNIRVKRESRIQREFYETGVLAPERERLRPWKTRPRTSVPGLEGPVPVPYTLEDLKAERLFDDDFDASRSRFVPTVVADQFDRLVAAEAERIEGLNVGIQEVKAGIQGLEDVKAVLEEESRPFVENVARAKNLSEKAAANQMRIRGTENELRVMGTAFERVVEDDPWSKTLLDEVRKRSAENPAPGEEGWLAAAVERISRSRPGRRVRTGERGPGQRPGTGV
ncbi:hypothetical protein [Actinorugispora endophytica]|uniref:Uncharacterized protein n=1 Tax=Actinorugispora endophytica TaxID=1605990 RepID=A0A4V3D6S1_9ACTN|nr:hypothetical protein [Actinorugispora endophytica]TDQ45037.1 hypothetical protein EV190_13329 [Actinorugispora endophytica]